MENKDEVTLSRVAEEIAPPAGGRLCVLPGVLVDESLDFKKIVSELFPHDLQEKTIARIGDKYAAKKFAAPVERNIFLVNLGVRVRDAGQALAWAGSNHLVTASLRTVFAGAAKYPGQNVVLGCGIMNIISFEERYLIDERFVPGVILQGRRLTFVFNWTKLSIMHAWFAFVKE